jgi:hypothetical protein
LELPEKIVFQYQFLVVTHIAPILADFLNVELLTAPTEGVRLAKAFPLGQTARGIHPDRVQHRSTTFQPVIRLNRETSEREMVMMHRLAI